MIAVDSVQTVENVNTVTITDGVAGEDALELTAEVKYSQNLHGYAYPWAGGKGKNLCNINSFSSSSASYIKVTGSEITLPPGQYTLSFNKSVSYPVSVKLNAGIWNNNTSTWAAINYYTASGTVSVRSVLSFSLAEETTIDIRVKRTSPTPYTITYSRFQIEKGNNATTYAPYENICPITGHTECNINRKGGNLCSVTSISLEKPGNTPVNVYPDAIPAGTYTLSWTSNATEITKLQFYNAVNAGTNMETVNVTSSGSTTITFSSPCLRIYAYLSSSAPDGTTAKISNIQIYADTTYSISWQADAGTVYGGTLDALNGILYVEKAEIASYNNEELTTEWISDMDKYTVGGKPTVGSHVVYNLERPVLYNLTPIQVAMLAGKNILQADTGKIKRFSYSIGDITAEYIQAMESGQFQHARITFLMDNIVFTDEDISQSGITLTTYMNPEVDLTFGTAVCTELTMVFLRSEKTDRLKWNREFKLEFGTEIGENITWVTIGYFVGQRPVQTQRREIEFTAYDRMYRFENLADRFLNYMTFPCTIRTLYDELCSFVAMNHVTGDEIDDVMDNYTVAGTEFEEDATYRDILSLIAEANGCYAKITNTGDVKLVWYSDHTADYSLPLDKVFDLDYTELVANQSVKWSYLGDFQWEDLEPYQYSEFDNSGTPLKVQMMCGYFTQAPKKIVYQPQPVDDQNHRTWASLERDKWQTLEDSTWKNVEIDPESGDTYYISNNELIRHSTDADIRTHLQYLLDRLQAFDIYYVANIQAMGNWLIEPGDIITIEVEPGKTTSYPVFNRTLQWNGSCICTYETTGGLHREPVAIDS